MLPAASSDYRLRVANTSTMMGLLGDHDRNLRVLESAFPAARIVARGNEISFSGDETEAELAYTVAEELMLMLEQGQAVDEPQVRRVVAMVRAEVPSPSDVLTDGVPVGRGKIVRPKTLGQKRYIDAIRDNTLTFGIGPAGTGKTYLAMASAVESLVTGSTRRIILTRPAVEAGERLGFLPGDLEAKINPYLRPLYDALYDMLGPEEVRRLLERGDIEIAPLAYMRGRTLNDACVILDEAQNTTPQQMKMFLTRLGFNSKMIITGDTTQVDLPTNSGSGLIQATRILSGIPDVGVVELTSEDVVRHRIVAAVIDAYETAERKKRR